LFACGFGVKESSAQAGCVYSARRSVAGGLRCVQPLVSLW